MLQNQVVGLLIVAAFLQLGSKPPVTDGAKNKPMNRPVKDFGKLHPNAPAELSRFGFLLGSWRCQARVKSTDDKWQTFSAKWVGRYALDGYAIEDEYRMSDSSGKLIVLGMNVRTYDSANRTWNIKWLNALTGTWTDLAPSEVGGARFDGKSVVYAFKEPVAGHKYTRATYTSVDKTHFTWRGDKSDDAINWSEFMLCQCSRAHD